MKNFSRLLSLPCLFSIIVGCTSAATPSEMFKGQSAEQIFTGGEKALAKGRYGSAVKHFEAFDSLYPFAPESEQAHLDIIYAYYKSGDLASAVAAADRFLHLYPRSARADYALYLKGLANYEQDRAWFIRYLPLDQSERDLGTAKEAFDDFSQLLRAYPNSSYAPDARQRMVHLRNLLAKYEVNIAQYYMQRQAYVAAANRANYVLQHYQQTPAMVDALGIMVKAYKKLGMNDRADEAWHVLQLNYPRSSVTKAVRKEFYAA